MDSAARTHSLSIALAAAVAATLFVSALTAPRALAAEGKNSCARQIVNDWYGDGTVDRIYPQHCYREAIRSLPVDVRDYSNAEEDILRALAYAKQGKPDPGPKGSNPGGGETTTTDTTSDTVDETTSTPTDTTDEDETVGAPGTDTSGPSSIPLPLIVLGGLAFLLLVAGGAGYVNRRMQTEGAGSDDASVPPES